MIDLYAAPTPNGWKISIMPEETGLPYTVHPIRLDRVDERQAVRRGLKVPPFDMPRENVDEAVESARKFLV
jgi:glutathione S-transferase